MEIKGAADELEVIQPLQLPPREAARRHSRLQTLAGFGIEWQNGGLKDFRRTAGIITQVHHHAENLVERELAKDLHFNLIKYNDNVDDWCNKIGPQRGPSQVLNRMNNQLDPWHADRIVIEKDNTEPFLERLEENVTYEPLEEGTLKAVSFLAHTWFRRAETELKDEIRQKEPAQVDLERGERLVGLLNRWWQAGKLEVVREGRRVLPGAEDLVPLLKSGRLPVRGNRIEIPPPEAPLPRELADEIFKGIKHWDEEAEQPGFERLMELTTSDPKTATDVLRVGLSSQGRRDLDMFNHLLAKSQQHESLKDCFRPLLPQIRRVIRDAEATDRVASNNLVGAAHVRLVANVARVFPEQIDEDYLEHEFKPLVTCGELNTMQDAFELVAEVEKDFPRLREVAVDAVLDGHQDDRSQFLLDYGLKTASRAIEEGYRVDQKQVDYLLSELVFPLSMRDKSASQVPNGYSEAFELLTLLDKQGQIKLDELAVPAPDGQVKPVRRAVFERIFAAGGDSLSEGRFGVDSEFLKNDRAIQTEMVDILEEALVENESLDKLPTDAQKAAGLLKWYGDSLDQRQRGRLEKMLHPHRLESVRGPLHTLLQPVRQADIQVGLEQISGQPMDPPEMLNRFLSNAAQIASLEGYRWNESKALKTSIESVATRLKKDGTAGSFADAWLAESNQTLAELAAKKKASVAEVATFKLLHALDPERTLRAVRPGLTSEHRGPSELWDDFKPLRKELIAENLELLKDPAQPPQPLLTELEKLAALNYEDAAPLREQGLKSWKMGQSTRPDDGWQRKLARNFKGLESTFETHVALSKIALSDKGWSRFTEALNKVGGESHYQDALKISTYVEAELAEGKPYLPALEHAMKAVAMGKDPQKLSTEKLLAPSETLQLEDEVLVGDHSLERF